MIGARPETRNPFVYGAAASGRAFVGRETEVSGLVRDLSQESRIFLISPRRYGKTSLILRALERLRAEGFLTVYVDLYQAASLEQFASLYACHIARSAETGLDAAIRLVQELLRSLKPEVSVDAAGEISVSLGAASPNPPLRRLEHILDAPEAVSRGKGKRLVVAFDEFQEIQTLGGEALEKLLRSVIQHHHDVSYLFAGSKKDILIEMTSDRGKAFYRMGKIEFLGKIPPEAFLPFINDLFRETKRPLSEGVAQAVFAAAEGVPYYVQYLCHELWNETPHGSPVSMRDVDGTLSRIVTSQGPLYLTLWDNLTLLQRRLLQALSKSEKPEIFSAEFLRKHSLGAPASIQTAIKALIKKDALEKDDGSYAFSDLWFREWVRRTLT